MQAEAQVNSQEKPTISFTIPSWILAITKIVDYGAKAVKTTTEVVEETVAKRSRLPKFNFNKERLPKFNFKLPRFVSIHKKAVAVIIVILVIGGFVSFKMANSDINLQANNDTGQDSSSGSSIVAVNRKFNIPIKTQDGKETGEDLNVTITTIETNNQILIQGKPAKAKDGKTFLIINMEIQNSTKKQLTVKPVDMVRLVDNEGRHFAPDVHNNEVSAEAISIRKTRVGYVVDSSQKSFKLLIGEVRGNQEAIEVGF